MEKKKDHANAKLAFFSLAKKTAPVQAFNINQMETAQ